MKRNIFFVSILLHFCAGQAQNIAFPSLEDLDRVVAEQQKYVDIREGRISDVKSKLRKTASEEERYQLKNFLFNEYSSYVVDSALHYAQEKLVSAYKMNRQDYIDDSRLNMAYVLIQGGMYKEASDISLPSPPRLSHAPPYTPSIQTRALTPGCALPSAQAFPPKALPARRSLETRQEQSRLLRRAGEGAP